MQGGRTMSMREIGTIYLEYCEFRKELNVKTINAYRIDLKQYFDFVGEDILNKKKIEKYITELHRKYMQKTVKRKIATVKAFYIYMEEEELIAENPFRKIKVKFKETFTLPRIIPRKEIEQMLNYMYSHPKKGDRYWLRDVAVVEMLFAVGARVYEISNIRTDCIDLSTGSMRSMGKGGRERCLQVTSPDVLRLIRRYYQANESLIKQSGYFFVNRNGNRYTEQSIRLMVKKYSSLAGIERNITPHMFRHSFATYLIEEGVDISCVQPILGHSSIRTTQIYIHVAAKMQAEILRAMHPRNKMELLGLVS